MTEGIELRNAQSGVILGGPEYPVDDQQVMVFDLPSGLWFPQPYGGGGGGSVTPLTAVAVADRHGMATTPDGSFSGDKAYNGTAAFQDAIDAMVLTGGGGIQMAPGTYDEDVEFSELQFDVEGLGYKDGDTQSVILNGSILLTVTDAICRGRFRNLKIGAAFSDGGSGADVELERVICNGLTITGALSCIESAVDATTCGAFTSRDSQLSSGLTCTSANTENTTVAGDFHATNSPCNYQSSTFGAGFRSEGVSVIRACTFAGSFQTNDPVKVYDSTFSSVGDTMLFLGSGVAVRGSTFAGTVHCGNDGDFFDCDFDKSVDATTELVFRQCRAQSDTVVFSAPTCKMDSETEIFGLKNGCAWSTAIVALSHGQGGDAVALDADATRDFTGVTRSYVCRTTLSVDITLTLAVTGSAPFQLYTLDVYASAHTVTVKFGAATLVVIPPQTAGQGSRYIFGVDEAGTSVEFLFWEKL